MDPEQLRNEVALVAFGGRWSDELKGALAQVAAAAATDPRARTLAEQWIRSGTAEQMWASGSDIDSWLVLIGWLAWLDDGDGLSSATADSLWASFVAIIEVIGNPSSRSTPESRSLLGEF